MIRVELLGVRVEIPNNQPIVLLKEIDGDRSLPIFIGNPEATAIVHAMQGIETPRPMTHDLLKAVIETQHSQLVSVEITELHDRTFHARLGLRTENDTIYLDARPSDALALAVRWGLEDVAILVDEAVLAEAGVVMDEDSEEGPALADEQIEEFRSFLDQISPEDFA